MYWMPAKQAKTYAEGSGQQNCFRMQNTSRLYRKRAKQEAAADHTFACKTGESSQTHFHHLHFLWSLCLQHAMFCRLTLHRYLPSWYQGLAANHFLLLTNNKWHDILFLRQNKLYPGRYGQRSTTVISLLNLRIAIQHLHKYVPSDPLKLLYCFEKDISN